MKGNWLIYGANGFTGEMIARRAVAKGMRPVLAGRNAQSVGKLASELGLEGRSFDLSDADAIRAGLQGCSLVLNCAGPFDHTWRHLSEAAIRSRCHYLDIAGEYAVFDNLQARSERARAKGVMLLPGVGFDVVPTDCMANQLKKLLPDAHKLDLAFVGPNKAAAGSIKTALRQLPLGSKIRVNGALQTIPHFSRTRTVRIEGTDHTIYAIPWGDLSTAFFSTGIPNIAVYTGFPPSQVIALKLLNPALALLRSERVLRFVERLVEKVVPEPDEEYFKTARCTIWGEVSNPSGGTRSAAFRTRDTYSLTLETATLCVQKVLDGTVKPGFQTPATVFGERLIQEVPDTAIVAQPTRY
ncbi:MAG: saccharopine dehydrogenase NADP-binding domain-containing protein [Nitrospirae bacterium]|nr:saccharopine dehydrogenase NADP-binding domain-containing protein [Nitrospirota bacterium]